MEVVQDYCNYIQITQGELDDLKDELGALWDEVGSEFYPLLLALDGAILKFYQTD